MTLSAASGRDVTLSYATSDGTASSSSDYVALPKGLQQNQNWGLQVPVYRKRPNPLQGLIDIADEDRETPVRNVIVTGRFIDLNHLDDASPHVLFRIHLINCCIYSIFFEGIEGKCDFQNSPLETDIDNYQGGGRSRWLRRHQGIIRFRQFIPQEIVDRIKSDIASDPSLVRGFSLSSVKIRFTADTPEGGTQVLSLGSNDPFIVSG